MVYQNESELFQVDESSDLPIWAQLRNRFAYLIKTGQFAPGEQLPSVRSLSAAVCINYNTVTKAYRDLELEGLIEQVRGRGMYVKQAANTQSSETTAIDAVVEDCLYQYREMGMTFADISEHMEDLIGKLQNK